MFLEVARDAPGALSNGSCSLRDHDQPVYRNARREERHSEAASRAISFSPGDFQKCQCFLGMDAQMAHHPGSTPVFRFRQEGEHQIADHSQCFRGVSLAYATGILTHCHVAHAEQLILDSPVRPSQFQQPFRRRLPSRKARNPEDHLHGFHTVDRSFPTQSKHLPYPWPVFIEVALKPGARLDGTTFNPTMCLVECGRGIKRIGTQLSLPGGKDPQAGRQRRLRCRVVNSADFP